MPNGQTAWLHDLVVDLQLRSQVCDRLYGAGVKYVGNLVQLSAHQLAMFFNFSENTIEEISAKLQERGLSLEMKLTTEQGKLLSPAKDGDADADKAWTLAYQSCGQGFIALGPPATPASERNYQGGRFHSGEW